MAARLASAPSSALRLLPSAVGCRSRHTPELFRLETSASSGLPALHNRLRKCSGFRERALNTVQTDTRRRCSNTPSLAALPVATILRSHHRAHSRSRHHTTPDRGISATLTGVHRASFIGIWPKPPLDHKRYTINARYVDMPTPLADIKTHTGADNHPAACSLRSASTPRKMGEAFVALSPWRFARRRLPTGTNSLRSLELSPCGRGCLATASLIHSAPPLRFRLHTSGLRTAPPTYALTSATIQGLYDIATYRHIGTIPSPYPKRGAAAHNSAPAAVAVADARPSGHSASIENLQSSNNPLFHRGSYGRAFRLGCIAPPFIIDHLPRPPPPRALPPPPRLPRHHPDVLPGYVNDAAESGVPRT